MHKNFKSTWFLLGLGEQLQVVASLSLTEAFILLAAPILLFRELPHMRRTGVIKFFYISLLLVIGCVISCLANRTDLIFVIRGLATTCILACAVVVLHWVMRNDMNGVKWYFLGSAISVVLCTFVFQRFGELEAYGDGAGGTAAVSIMSSNPLFWIQRLNAFVTLPGRGWYLTTPLWISAGGVGFMALFAIFKSSSGRSSAIGAIASFLLIIIAGKKREGMLRVSRYLIFWLVGGLFCLQILNIAYRTAAESGVLGETSRKKYEAQTQRGKDIKSLLLSGRAESFVGLLACRDKPLTGWGPWARDEKNYRLEFMSKYGTPEDYDRMLEWDMRSRAAGRPTGLIQCHSYIVEFWVWYGVLGLLYWLYVIFTLIRYIKKDIAIVPQWYCWLVAGMPSMFWAIFFSPLTARVGVSMFVIACLMARAIRKGWYPMPYEMICEIEKIERR